MRSSMAVTAATSPSSFPQSSAERGLVLQGDDELLTLAAVATDHHFGEVAAGAPLIHEEIAAARLCPLNGHAMHKGVPIDVGNMPVRTRLHKAERNNIVFLAVRPLPLGLRDELATVNQWPGTLALRPLHVDLRREPFGEAVNGDSTRRRVGVLTIGGRAGRCSGR